MDTSTKSIRVLALLILAFAAQTAFGQAYPVKPIRLVVPFPPGGTGDLIGRLAAREMQAALGALLDKARRAQARRAYG